MPRSASTVRKPQTLTPERSFQLSGAQVSLNFSPARGIEVYFLQAGETWPLATLDAGRNFTFDTRLRVPAGAEAGRATVRATTRSGEHVERRFLVLR